MDFAKNSRSYEKCYFLRGTVIIEALFCSMLIYELLRLSREEYQKIGYVGDLMIIRRGPFLELLLEDHSKLYLHLKLFYGVILNEKENSR